MRALVLACLLACAGRAQTVITAPHPPNTSAQQAKHYVVLVSLDGFRYDYPAKYGAPHLESMAAHGASAPDGMLPSYPSLTFPNHLALITGLYPEHHGIVANSFYDPARKATYVYTQPKTNGDGSWYTGTPLWVLAEQQGMRSACLFWPGSEAEIQGKRPSYYLHFDDTLDDEKRIDQIVAWLGLSAEERPHFLTLYYAEVDHAGHAFGPDSNEVRDAVHHLDAMIGELQEKLAATHLPIDLIVVADHGMTTLKPDPIVLSDFANLDHFRVEGSLLYPETEADAARAYAEFRAHPDPRFTAYRRAEVPPALHFDANPREGDPVLVPNGPYTFRATAPRADARPAMLHGGHGFDPKMVPEMKAIFYAEGVDIRPHLTLPSFKNVDLYPFAASLLGLTPPPGIDGEVEEMQPAIVGEEDRPRDAAADVVNPVLVHRVIPRYSREAMKAKIEAEALVELWVERNGLPSHLRVLKSAGYGLDEEALKAIAKYRFRPATQGGVPVTTRVNVDVSFHVR